MSRSLGLERKAPRFRFVRRPRLWAIATRQAFTRQMAKRVFRSKNRPRRLRRCGLLDPINRESRRHTEREKKDENRSRPKNTNLRPNSSALVIQFSSPSSTKSSYDPSVLEHARISLFCEIGSKRNPIPCRNTEKNTGLHENQSNDS